MIPLDQVIAEQYEHAMSLPSWCGTRVHYRDVVDIDLMNFPDYEQISYETMTAGAPSCEDVACRYCT